MRITDEQRKQIVRTLLVRLYKQGKWSNKGHTPIENAQKGFPAHLVGAVKDIVQDLVREGLLIAARHSYGIGISLNQNKLKEIEAIIERDLL